MMHVTRSRASIIRTLAMAAITTAASVACSHQADAQNAVLAEMYGRGVHAYYGGNHTDAYNLLSMAINNGSQDPRAYYFRGIVADAQGRSYEAESDWQRGAQLEAAGGQNPAVGRALARFQGGTRLKLEQIRQKARLQALSMAAARSQARYGEINAMQPAPAMIQPTPSMMAPPSAVTPPPAPDMGNPFGNDNEGMVAGEPKVESDDALEGATDPMAESSAPAADATEPAVTDPFGGSDDAGTMPADDPFASPAAGDTAPADDPFASPPADSSAPAMDDPFAPSADGGAAMDDPFAS